MLVIKDRSGKPVDDKRQFAGKWYGSPDWSLYFPMTVRFTAVVVAKGARFSPAAATWRAGGMHVKDVRLLKSVASSWRQGRLGAALKAARKEIDSEDAATAEEARKVVAALEAHAAERRDILDKAKTAAPTAAPKELLRLARLYAGSTLGKELSSTAKNWSKDPDVVRARKAIPLLTSLQKAAGSVRGKGDLSEPALARKHARAIAHLQALAARLIREYPGTPSSTQARALLKNLGIPLEE